MPVISSAELTAICSECGKKRNEKSADLKTCFQIINQAGWQVMRKPRPSLNTQGRGLPNKLIESETGKKRD